MAIFVGIDVGTSGSRAVAIDDHASLLASAHVALPPPEYHGAGAEQDAEVWWRAVRRVLSELNRQIDAGDVAALAVDGTSGTMMLCGADGTPLAKALMYNDGRATEEADRIASVAPVGRQVERGIQDAHVRRGQSLAQPFGRDKECRVAARHFFPL